MTWQTKPQNQLVALPPVRSSAPNQKSESTRAPQKNQQSSHTNRCWLTPKNPHRHKRGSTKTSANYGDRSLKSGYKTWLGENSRTAWLSGRVFPIEAERQIAAAADHVDSSDQQKSSGCGPLHFYTK